MNKTEQRFWKKVIKTDTCWNWIGATSHGYAVFSHNKKCVLSHRFIYELTYGEMPKGKRIYHQCNNQICVNPEHLFIVEGDIKIIQSKASKRWRLSNPDKVKEINRRYAQNNPHKKRESALKKYGITQLEYDCLLSSQDNGCAICGSIIGGISWGGVENKLSIDHDHITGRVRGLLCGNCNRGIGLFKDDPELLQKAKDYLSYYSNKGKIR